MERNQSEEVEVNSLATTERERTPGNRRERDRMSWKDMSLDMTMDEFDTPKYSRENERFRNKGDQRLTIFENKVVARERLVSLKNFYLKERKTYESLVKEEIKKKGM